MSYDKIVEAVKKLKKRYCESDPFRLCKDMGIQLNCTSLGTEDDAIKGFFLEQYHIQTIIVNSDLPYSLQRLILCHEIGHAMLHRKNGICTFHDVSLFDMSGSLEQEANLFAAEFLLDDEEVFQKLNDDFTFFQAAADLNIPMELLDFKFRIMKWKGYKMVEPPISAYGNFLANIEIPQTSDDCNW